MKEPPTNNLLKYLVQNITCIDCKACVNTHCQQRVIWSSRRSTGNIMEEVKQYNRNLAVPSNDYKKAYDEVHHDWMLYV